MRVGNHQTYHGDNMFIVGNHNKVTGNNNSVTGNHNTISGNNNTITGNHNKAVGNNGQITGNYNKIVGNNWSHAGRNNSMVTSTTTMTLKKRKVEKPKVKKIQVPKDEEFCHDEDVADDQTSCVICYERKPICIISPCNHKILCVTCSIQLAKNKNRGEVKCPECRENIKRIGRVFE